MINGCFILVASITVMHQNEKGLYRGFWFIIKNPPSDYTQDLLYTSGAAGDHPNGEHYVHLIAVSQKTGYTINILTAGGHGFTKDDADKALNFISKETTITEFAREVRTWGFLLLDGDLADHRNGPLPFAAEPKGMSITEPPHIDAFQNGLAFEISHPKVSPCLCLKNQFSPAVEYEQGKICRNKSGRHFESIVQAVSIG